GAVHDAAARALRAGAPGLAVAFLSQLLDGDLPLPAELREVWLAEAVAAARAADDSARVSDWTRQLDELRLGTKK
ncbi:MAG TPA: hypothetical protein PLU52_13475, partial [Opitutaceae bacterium]|nr:hypothetical protein [Opitutaceae bacterium]